MMQNSQNPHISIIVAIAKNYAIGLNNRLLYRLPNDMKRFKALTTGHTIIMGRKTFESLPKGALPNRRNIVLSRQDNATFAGAECYHSLDEALQHCDADEEIYIIGGEQLYRQSLPQADTLYLTLVDDMPTEADAFFPTLDDTDWVETKRDAHSSDEKHLYSYTFIDCKRR